MRHTFEASQWVPYPPAQVFAFFSDPQNLPPLMPAWQKARIEHAFLAAPPLSQHQWNGTQRTGRFRLCAHHHFSRGSLRSYPHTVGGRHY